MGKSIIEILIMLVFLTGQSDQAIVIEIDCHWAHDGCDQNVYSEIILVSLVQRRFLDVLLHNVLILWLFNLSSLYLFPLSLVCGIGIRLQNLNTLLHLQVLIHSIPFSFRISIQSPPHFFNFLCNENTSSLRARLRLTDEKYDWVILSFRLSYHTIFYFLSSFVLLPFSILLYIMKFSWVYPCWWKEIVMVRKFLLKSFQVHTKRTFPADVIHTQVVINSLTRSKTAQEFGSHSSICPEYVPVIWVKIISNFPEFFRISNLLIILCLLFLRIRFSLITFFVLGHFFLRLIISLLLLFESCIIFNNSITVIDNLPSHFLHCNISE